MTVCRYVKITVPGYGNYGNSLLHTRPAHLLPCDRVVHVHAALHAARVHEALPGGVLRGEVGPDEGVLHAVTAERQQRRVVRVAHHAP